MIKLIKQYQNTRNISNVNNLTRQIFIIKSIVKKINIPVNIVGYKYIIDCVLYMINSQNIIFITEAYSLIAENYNTSLSCIEISIRNALKKSLNSSEEVTRSVLKISNFSKVTNSIFLNALKEIVLEKIMEKNFVKIPCIYY